MSGFLSSPLGEDLTGFAESAVGPLAASLLAGTGPYRTKPVPHLPPALYSLAIRAGSAPFLPMFIYLFPLSPQLLRKERAGMGNFYDVAGSPSLAGVQRIPDLYGYSPPIWTIAGTTGVKRHSTDRYLFTGLQSALVLQACMEQYFSFVAAAAQSGGSNGAGPTLPRMEFYDYFSSDFWQVVPLGPQGVSQTARAPQLVEYSFRFIGVQSLLQPLVSEVDSLVGQAAQGIGAGISNLSTSVSNSLGSYSSSSPVA